ncbi:unnamed protein product [Brassica rapa subsp. narinosa]
MEPLQKNFSDMTISGGVTGSTSTLHRNSLPILDEVIAEIFSRLSSESIARCRCVCKLWSSILAHQDFTESFLTKSRARPQLLFACDACTGVFFFSSAQPENPKENSFVVASNHLARFSISDELCGCTNGFFLYVSKMIWIENELQLYVPLMCNPSTGQFLTLPKLKSGKSCGVQSYLGYEPFANELKVFSMEVSRVNGVLISVEHQVLTTEAKILSWSYSLISMVACFDLRSEKLSFIKFMETFSKEMHHSATIVNYNGKLGLLMSRDYGLVHRANASFELWVLQDAAKHEWSKLVFVLPPLWKDVVVDTMCISGMVGTNEIVFSPIYQRDPFHVIYYNVESKTITKIGIQGLEAFQETWTPLSLLLKPHHNRLTGNYDVSVMVAALEGKGKSVEWHDKRYGAYSINLGADTLMGIVLNVPVTRYVGLWRSRRWVVMRKINGIWYNLDCDLTVPQPFTSEDEVKGFLDQNLSLGGEILVIKNLSFIFHHRSLFWSQCNVLTCKRQNNRFKPRPQLDNYSEYDVYYMSATETKRCNANTRPVTCGKQSSVKGSYGKNPGCTTSCGLRLPKKTEATAARLVKVLSCKLVKGLRLVVMRRKKKRSPPLKASSTGRSQPSVISVPNDTCRSEAIEDCIQFINSSTSFIRSSSVSGRKS